MSEDNNYSGKFKISNKNSLMSNLISSNQGSDQNFENNNSFSFPTEKKEKNYQKEEKQEKEEEKQEKEEEKQKLNDYFESLDPMSRQHQRHENTKMVNGLTIPEKMLENGSNRELSQIARASALYHHADNIEEMARNKQNKNKFGRQLNTTAFMSVVGLSLFYIGSNLPFNQDFKQSAAIAIGTCAWKFVSNYMRSKKFGKIADNLHVDSQNPDSDLAGMKEWKDCLMNFDFEKADQVAKENNLYDVALNSKEKFNAESEVRTEARDIRYKKNEDSKIKERVKKRESKKQPEQGQPEQNFFDKVISKVQKAKKQGLNKSNEKKNSMGI